MIAINLHNGMRLVRTYKDNSNSLTLESLDGGVLNVYDCTDRQFYGMIELFGDDETRHHTPLETHVSEEHG